MTKRNIYLNTIPVEEAKEKYITKIQNVIQDEHESIRPEDSLGRITTKPITALCNSPLTDSSAMDGIAVIAKKTVGADERTPLVLQENEDYINVDTGDPILPPYDSVIMIEDLRIIDDESVEIRAAATPWQNIRPIGEDIVQGEMILPGRHQIRPMDLGVLLAGGITSIEVYKKPSIGIIPTGTEIIKSGDTPGLGDIIDSNSSMLEGMSIERNCRVNKYEPVPDEYEKIKQKILSALEENDMLAIIAGSSAGTEDYTVHILRDLGEVIVHGVSIKPGKPVILAIIEGKPVIGVPGYPVSAYLAFDIFATPVMALFSHIPMGEEKNTKAIITRRLISSLKHREYVRVKMGLVDDKLIATPLARGAGAAMSLVRADGFCIIDKNSEGVEAGDEVDIKLLRTLPELYSTLIAIGSHDLMLDIIDDLMLRTNTGVSLSSTHVGSMGGLMALLRAECHLAPTHILDPESGVYNIEIIKEIFKPHTVALIKGAGRTQGIMVKKGNPLDIKGLSDLTHCRFVNRQRGAGTRILLDYQLDALGISSKDIDGYTREAATHMAVAAAVAGESADAGLGIYSAANSMELDFIPVADEEYDFALRKDDLDLHQMKIFIDVLKSDALKQNLSDLGGYNTERSGEVIYIE